MAGALARQSVGAVPAKGEPAGSTGPSDPGSTPPPRAVLTHVEMGGSASSPDPGSARPPRASLAKAETPVAKAPSLEAVPEKEPSAPAGAQEASDGDPVWPDESAEMAFLAQAGFGERPETPAAPELAAPVPQVPVEREVLPALEDLLPRIPAEVVAALDEHFRAKFTSVRRIPREALKP